MSHKEIENGDCLQIQCNPRCHGIDKRLHSENAAQYHGIFEVEFTLHLICATLAVVKSKRIVVTCDEFKCVIPTKKITLNEIILLQKYLPEPTLTTRIVFKIELVKAMKCTLVGVNVQKVNIEIVSVK
jgi:hypothetical protein